MPNGANPTQGGPPLGRSLSRLYGKGSSSVRVAPARAQQWQHRFRVPLGGIGSSVALHGMPKRSGSPDLPSYFCGGVFKVAGGHIYLPSFFFKSKRGKKIGVPAGRVQHIIRPWYTIRRASVWMWCAERCPNRGEGHSFYEDRFIPTPPPGSSPIQSSSIQSIDRWEKKEV